MASWLKVAEDLLEVVDRRAKLVVSELADEQTDSQSTASRSEEVHAKKTKLKEKGQVKLPGIENRRSNRIEKVEKSKDSSVTNEYSDKSKNSPPELYPDAGANDAVETNREPLPDSNMETTSLDVEISKSENGTTNDEEGQVVENNPLTVSTLNEDTNNANSNDEFDMLSSTNMSETRIQNVDAIHPADAGPKVTSVDEDTLSDLDQNKSESGVVEREVASNNQENKGESISETSPVMTKHQEYKTDSPVKVDDPLDEAQGLLKTAIKTGQSKEARLARVCAGLSSRLQEYKAENKQLEELLAAERELSSSYEVRTKKLQQELSASKVEVAKVESNLSDALTAKNAEIEVLAGSVDSLKKQAASSEEKLASLLSDMEAIRRTRELTETRMIQALREELASAERRAEEERIAHSSTKKAAVEREVELEHRALEASNALARIQRTAGEAISRAAELEHKVALLEVECASLNQELQDMEARNRRGQKKSSEEANQLLQMQAWQEEVDRARRGQREAENKLSSLEAELQKMRVEMAGMKRDAEHYSRQEHVELEKRYRELTDLLYHKQTQLETVISEKAALEFQLEKELKRLQEAQLEAERSRTTRRAASSWEEDTDMKSLEPLPLHHRHMVGASRQLQRAAKLLDSGAVRATRFLWQYPTARVILLCYLVFVHLFLMYLLHRLQEQVDTFSSKEVAASLGLNSSSLP